MTQNHFSKQLKPNSMRIEELKIDVDDLEDFEDRAEEIITDFCGQLEKQEGMTRPVDEDDEVEEGQVLFMWTTKASNLIEAHINELYVIGRKYFGDDAEFEVSTYMYREF